MAEAEDGARHLIGALGLVRNDIGQVLLVKTASAGWELPGGRVERGEDLIAALEREVMEESHCRVAVERLCGIYSHMGARSSVLMVFCCRHLDGEPHPGDDSLEARWFTPEEAVQAVVHASERTRLEDALAGDSVVYRAFLPAPASSRIGAYEEVRTARWPG